MLTLECTRRRGKVFWYNILISKHRKKVRLLWRREKKSTLFSFFYVSPRPRVSEWTLFCPSFCRRFAEHGGHALAPTVPASAEASLHHFVLLTSIRNKNGKARTGLFFLYHSWITITILYFNLGRLRCAGKAEGPYRGSTFILFLNVIIQ